jgi:NAD(P)-dependent dehydrogenase (short-subunit alcohol dehydrogenase family)
MSHVVLITGAATGMGALASVALAERGHIVYARMRDPDGRNQARTADLRDRATRLPGQLHPVDLDILDDGSTDRAVARVMEEAGRIDVLINNAGHMALGVTEAFTPEQLVDLAATNYVGAHRVTRAVLPHMRHRGEGLLLWNGSGATRAIPPFLGPYSAAKAAFDALAESYAWDVESLGIETTIIHPGVFTQDAEHVAKAVAAAHEDRAAAYASTPAQRRLDSTLEDTTRLFDGRDPADPQIVADEICRIVDREIGMRPRRTVADGSDYGAEIINGASEELRIRLARRMGLTELLGREGRAISPREGP